MFGQHLAHIKSFQLDSHEQQVEHFQVLQPVHCCKGAFADHPERHVDLLEDLLVEVGVKVLFEENAEHLLEGLDQLAVVAQVLGDHREPLHKLDEEGLRQSEAHDQVDLDPQQVAQMTDEAILLPYLRAVFFPLVVPRQDVHTQVLERQVNSQPVGLQLRGIEILSCVYLDVFDPILIDHYVDAAAIGLLGGLFVLMVPANLLLRDLIHSQEQLGLKFVNGFL